MDKNITLVNFDQKIKFKDKTKLIKYLKKIDTEIWPKFLISFKKNYKYSYNQKFINKYERFGTEL